MGNGRCRWRDGCNTILSIYNKTELCGIHRRLEEERTAQESIGNKISPEDMAIAVVDETEIVKSESIVDRTIQTICLSYRVTKDELLGYRRHPRVAFPRQVAAYLLRIDTKRSFPNIAADLKRKDHTTIIHACEKIKKLAERNPEFRKNIETIRQLYKGPA